MQLTAFSITLVPNHKNGWGVEWLIKALGKLVQLVVGVCGEGGCKKVGQGGLGKSR